MTVEPFQRSGLRLALSRNGEGRPMVFQHGLCGDAAQPLQVFPTGERYECLTLESRGHGTSEPGDPASFTIATFADDVCAMIDRLGIGPVVMGGISMGAAISVRIAVTRPDLVRALVIARPAWVTDFAPQNMAPNAYVGELLRDYPPDAARDRFERSAIVANLSESGPDNLASLRGFFTRSPLPVTSELLMRISSDGPGISEEDLRALDVPALIIGHEMDHVHPIAMAREMAALVPAAQFVEITPKATRPEQYRTDFRSALSSFLKGI